MSTRMRLIIALAAALAVSTLCGCGGDGGGGGGGGTVTGEVYGSLGGSFVPLGGQGVAIGSRTAVSQPTTGRFTITGVPAGPFTIVVTPQQGFGEVLNEDVLDGTALSGQPVDVGRILLGQRPPDPA